MKKQGPWFQRSTLLASITILALLMVFAAFDAYYKVSPEGRFTKRPSCYDTDKGKDFYKKGAVVTTTYENNCDKGCFLVKEDECTEQGIVEYSCDSLDASKQLFDIKPCICEDGRCVG